MGYTARNFRGYLSGAGALKPASVATGAITGSSLVTTGNVTAARHLASSLGTAAEPAFAATTALDGGLYWINAALTAIAAGGSAYIYGSSSQCVPNLALAPNLSVTTVAKVIATPAAAQSITGVGVAIAPTRKIHEFTSDGNYTLTVAPTIADGTDGEEIILVNVGANTVTLQDQGSLASSNLRLTGASVAIGPRDSIRMYYSGDVGDWVQIGALVAVV